MTDLVLSRPVPEALPAAIAKYVVSHLTTELQGKRYVTVAGATAVASALGYSVREAEGGSKYVPKGEHLPGYWECTAEVLDPTGAVIGRGTGMVADDESPWSKRPLFAKRAMASTRAAGRALRLAVGHLFAGLGAGVQTVTLEEMPMDESAPEDRHVAEAVASVPQKPQAGLVDPGPGEQGGEFTASVVAVKATARGVQFNVTFDADGIGRVRLSCFERQADTCREALEKGDRVVVKWQRNGQWLNMQYVKRAVGLASDEEIPF